MENLALFLLLSLLSTLIHFSKSESSSNRKNFKTLSLRYVLVLIDEAHLKTAAELFDADDATIICL